MTNYERVQQFIHSPLMPVSMKCFLNMSAQELQDNKNRFSPSVLILDTGGVALGEDMNLYIKRHLIRQFGHALGTALRAVLTGSTDLVYQACETLYAFEQMLTRDEEVSVYHAEYAELTE